MFIYLAAKVLDISIYFLIKKKLAKIIIENLIHSPRVFISARANVLKHLFWYKNT